MNKEIRKLNKYERAYLNRVKKLYKRRGLFNVFLLNIFYFLKNNINSLYKKITIYIPKVKENIINNSMSDIKQTTTRTIRRIIKKKKPPILNKTKNEIKNKFWFWFKRIIGFLVILFLLSLGFLLVWFSSLEIPNVDNFDKRKISNSTKIYDRTGEILLYDIHEDIQRSVVVSDQISQSAKDAIIAIEDHTFYDHKGVVWKSTIRAVLQTIFSKIGLFQGGSAGGSTLTQQMVKNTLLTREKTVTRKMKEWVLAYKIENKLSKDEILTIYLNEAPYGGTIYGIQEASRVFFGKTALELSIAESAYLASIPNLPTFYSPYGQNKDKLKERQKTVLAEMKKYAYISDEQYREALAQEVEFLPQTENNAKALHFVQYIRAQLEEKYGVDVVENGGLKVITTLDYKLQQEAEQIIKDHIENVKDEYDATNAALVAIESKTGQIIAMVGSRDYFDTDEFDGNFNVALALRQPGSSFKPFAYATAFEKGYLPESRIFDVQTQFNSSCESSDTTSNNGCYSPNNHDFKFSGSLTWREALAQSRNIPAIKVLYLAGVSEVLKKSRELGITSLTKSPTYYGLGLVLGGGEVSLLEMVSGYATFSNNGAHNKTTGILEISDIEGTILEKFEKDEDMVFSKNTASMVSSILSDNNARAPLFGAQSFLYFGEKSVAGKTGTTNDNRDAWLIGYTSDVALGVWTGNNDNSPMKKGSSISGKPWREFMNKLIGQYGTDNFTNYNLPENFNALPNMIKGEWFGGISHIIDSISGKLATEFTPDDTKITVTNFDPHTILHSIDKNNPQEPGSSQSDSQYKNWEYAVQKYSRENYKDLYNPNFIPPTELDDVHTPDGVVVKETFDFDIKGLQEYYAQNDFIKATLDFKEINDSKVKNISYYINNTFTGSVESEPFEINIKTSEINYFNDDNILRVVVTNNNDEKVTKEKSFKLLKNNDNIVLEN